MSSEWQAIRLGDHCLKIGSGATPQGGKESYLEFGNYCLFRSQNIHNDGFKIGGLVYLNDAQAKKLQNVAVEVSDVLLNITGDSVARVCLAPTHFLPARVNQHVAIIRPKAEVFDSRFIRYFLASPIQQDLMLGLASTGGTRNALTKSMIEDFKIPCPSLSIQKQISDILSALDDRITLLRETNATLEAIAQALFKSWFVDFDPVHAKAQGRQPEGMDEQTATLFPDRFVESELGMVPLGWEVKSVHEVAEIVKGKSYTSKELVNENHTALVTLKSFERGGGFRLNGFKPYTGSYKPNQVVESGDLIVAYTDVTQAAELIGKPAIVIGVSEYQTLVASLDVGIIRPKEKVDKQFLYGLFCTELFQTHTFSHTTGTTVLHLAKDGIGLFRFVCPSPEIICAFGQTADAIAKKKQTNIDQIRTLTDLRDTLLPRLISGQLRLPDVEA